MQLPLDSASTQLPLSAEGAARSLQRATLAYQSLTIAAMLLLLASLWAF